MYEKKEQLIEATSIFIIDILGRFPRKWRFCSLEHGMEALHYLQIFYAIFHKLNSQLWM